MFDNAWLYNKKTSRVYKYCTKLTEVFDSVIDEAMQSLGYCCGMRVSLLTLGWALIRVPTYGWQDSCLSRDAKRVTVVWKLLHMV